MTTDQISLVRTVNPFDAKKKYKWISGKRRRDEHVDSVAVR